MKTSKFLSSIVLEKKIKNINQQGSNCQVFSRVRVETLDLQDLVRVRILTLTMCFLSLNLSRS